MYGGRRLPVLESQVDDLITGEQVASPNNKIQCRIKSNLYERRKDLGTVPQVHKKTYETVKRNSLFQ